MNNNSGCASKVIMGKLKKAPLIVIGTVVGIVTLRTVQKRRSKDTEAEPQETEDAEAEPQETEEDVETATDHAKAVVERTRRAARKTKQNLPRTAE